MQDYKSVEEKAAEWKMSPRHVQHLCRNKRIEGAVKHAGVWFVPSNAPSPARNSRAGGTGFEFVGTKRKIFYAAIELFVARGFENVGLRDIAEQVGVRQSTIYNHFKSKQDILDAIYDFYCHYYLKDRLSLAEMEKKLRNGSIIDVLRNISYDFKEEYIYAMSDITKIIFQRIAIDARAREIGKSLMVDEGIKYVEDVFERALEIGRLAPFGTHMMAVVVNSVRIFTLYNWILDPSPDNMARVVADEQALYEGSVNFLQDLHPEWGS